MCIRDRRVSGDEDWQNKHYDKCMHVFDRYLNDIEMLQNAGISYAVSNARQEVIAAAQHTCAPYWENGVLNVLKSFL